MIHTQKFGHEKFDDEKITKSINGILAKNHLLSIATVKKQENHCEPLIATCAYAFSEDCELYILTPPTSRHGIAMRDNPRIALSVYDSRQEPEEPKKGLQIDAVAVPAHQANFSEAIQTYKDRFDWMEQFVRWHPEWREESEDSWIYKLSPTTIKIFDEETFGEEAFVTVEVPGSHMLI